VEGTPRTTRLRWLPNAITILRLAGLPLLVWFLAIDDGPTSTRAALCFGAIGATDFIDGKLARYLGAESRFGRIADPFADRMLIALNRYTWPGPTIILARDVIAIAAFVLLAGRGVVLHVDMAGKIGSTLAMFAVGLALLTEGRWADAVFWVAVAVSLVTFLNYAGVAVRRLRVSGST
jgi:CDP-diacylglycerol--glycerol-3-phosphate 3-phosphatidyltransferase